ncbi:hypothetical protein [Micromonospora maritima]|uniref:hypothetical protein n=1 Tax=Micromonospora maritima TaxID=986711 RepID=UPI00157D36C5|nr:hypothetical protein [Micromonospora maritima]
MTTDIDAIRKLADAATDGPWRTWTVDPRPRFQVGPTSPFRPVAEVYERDEHGNDSTFIAAARTFVPQLCDEIEQLTAYNRAVKGANEDLRARVAELTADAARADRLDQELATLRDDNADLNRRLRAANAEIASHNKAVTHWAEQVEQLKKQLAVAQGALAVIHANELDDIEDGF